MKKSRFLFALFSITVIFVGCQKNDELTVQKAPYLFSVNAGVLEFNSIEDYDKTISDWSELSTASIMQIHSNIGFSSLYEEYLLQKKETSLPVKDELFTLLLNVNSEIIIASKKIKVDFKKKKIYTIDDSKNSNEYSFNDDVLADLNEECDKGLFNRCSQCGYIDNEKTQWTNEGDVFMEIEYNRYGIYYSFVYLWDGEGTQHFSNVTTSITNISGYISECGSSSNLYYSNSGMSSNYNSWKLRIYAGSKRLDRIHASGHFKVVDSGTTRFNQTLRVDCH